ncbi:MAG: hypothetical protein ACXVZR_11415 [Terriglobales bacterium]
MPGVLKIDRKRKVAVSTFYGAVSDEDLLTHRKTILDSPAFDPSFSEVVDFSRVSSLTVSEAALSAMAQAKSIFNETSIHVIVAPADIAFQLVSQYRELARLTRPNLYVVRSVDEAYAVLDSARDS